VLAKKENIRIFEAAIIYHLEESFRKHMEASKRDSVSPAETGADIQRTIDSAFAL
jgi:translation initiation factor IF-2